MVGSIPDQRIPAFQTNGWQKIIRLSGIITKEQLTASSRVFYSAADLTHRFLELKFIQNLKKEYYPNVTEIQRWNVNENGNDENPRK
jgi:hypothetical protein